MPGHECYHCKQWVEEGEAHDCWTTTEQALTRDLTEDLRDAWERLRETAADFGEQRIYASHSSIMFSRKACYFFVRPKSKHLEVFIFLGRTVRAPQVKRIQQTSKVKVGHTIHVTHRDEVEAPLTEWLREAYEFSDTLTAKARTSGKEARPKPAAKAAGKPPAPKKARKAVTTVKKAAKKTAVKKAAVKKDGVKKGGVKKAAAKKATRR